MCFSHVVESTCCACRGGGGRPSCLTGHRHLQPACPPSRPEESHGPTCQLPEPRKGVTLTHLLATHPSAGHLEIVFTQAIWAQRVMRASLEQGPDRLLQFKDQVHIPCSQQRRKCVSPAGGPSSALLSQLGVSCKRERVSCARHNLVRLLRSLAEGKHLLCLTPRPREGDAYHLPP